MKMTCGVYLNNRGFKVGRKYLSLIRAYSGEVLKKKELTPALLETLEGIKTAFSPSNIERTAAVLDLFSEEE